MHAQNNRQNKDFQIAYFLAGSCHTPDGAYALLCDLREGRSDALKHAEASKLRQRAKRIRAERLMNGADEADQFEGKADLVEIEAGLATANACYDAAIAELSTINKCIDLVQPLRRFAHLTDPEAHEAAQHDEWKLELIHRAENALLTGGCIPADQLATMRMHPAFGAEILPAIDNIKTALATPATARALLTGKPPTFNLPQLMENADALLPRY